MRAAESKRNSPHRAAAGGARGLQGPVVPVQGVWIGTSGWHYDSWRGPFFPKGLPARDYLRFYAEHFATTELNGVFYRTPSEAAVCAWRDATPEDFRFAWKASKFITHWKRLSEKSANSIALMESRLKILGRKAGPVLFQLPPRMRADRERLAAFLEMLPKQRRYAFEFRHPSWYEEEIFAVLRDRDIALCLSDHHDAPAPWELTASHVYVRGQGPGGRYRGDYPDRTLLDRALAAAGPRDLLLFRQRPEERRARRRAAADRDGAGLAVTLRAIGARVSSHRKSGERGRASRLPRRRRCGMVRRGRSRSPAAAGGAPVQKRAVLFSGAPGIVPLKFGSIDSKSIHVVVRRTTLV